MKYEIKVATIEKKLPPRFAFPKSFDKFVDACSNSQRGDLGWFSIKYQAPKKLLGFDPGQAIIPFLGLPDGGIVAFWFGGGSTPAIVSVDHDGDRRVVATSWSDFLTRLSAKKTKVPDLDDRELKGFPKIGGTAARPGALAKKQREFKSWLKANEPEEEVSGGSADSERIRSKLFQLTKRHLEDEYDSCNLYVTFTSRTYKVEWANFGIKPYPAQQRLKPVLQELVEYLGRSMKKTEIVIDGDGCVFVDQNTCLGDKKLYES